MISGLPVVLLTLKKEVGKEEPIRLQILRII